MALQLVDLCRESADDRGWVPPFDWDIAYENEHWWNRQRPEELWFVQVLENSIEVARVELDDPGRINPAYRGLPKLAGERLEIQLIEVAISSRSRGVGAQVVSALAQRHPDRRLFAYSEADQFWTRLGWEPFYDSRPGPPGRTLFIQPAHRC